MTRHGTLLALMLASGAMTHRQEIFLCRDIGGAAPARVKSSLGNEPSSDRHHRERDQAAQAKRKRREERNRRNAAKQEAQ